MKVCIAEKPSVAKDIAEVIGAKSRKVRVISKETVTA